MTVSEVIYAFGQGLFIFFVAPYIEDSSMILGAYMIITLPLILSILFPQVCSHLVIGIYNLLFLAFDEKLEL